MGGLGAGEAAAEAGLTSRLLGVEENLAGEGEAVKRKTGLNGCPEGVEGNVYMGKVRDE